MSITYILYYIISYTYYLSVPGHPSNAPIHENIELVIWQHLLPHDDRQPSAGVQVAV